MLAGILWANRLLGLEYALPNCTYSTLGWQSRTNCPFQQRRKAGSVCSKFVSACALRLRCYGLTIPEDVLRDCPRRQGFSNTADVVHAAESGMEFTTDDEEMY